MCFCSVLPPRKYCISTLDFMFKGFFQKNYEKIKTLFHFEWSKIFFLLSRKMLFVLMFVIEPDSFNSYSCCTLTEVNNPLYMFGCLLWISSKYTMFQNMSSWGLFEQRTNTMGLVRLFRLTPKNILYIQPCSDITHVRNNLSCRFFRKGKCQL